MEMKNKFTEMEIEMNELKKSNTEMENKNDKLEKIMIDLKSKHDSEIKLLKDEQEKIANDFFHIFAARRQHDPQIYDDININDFRPR